MKSKNRRRRKGQPHLSLVDTAPGDEKCNEPLFLKLPIEIRLRMYEIIMPNVTFGIRNATRGRNRRQTRMTFISRSGQSKQQFLDQKRSLRGLISLFFTSKVLSAEAIEFIYSRVTFAFTSIKSIVYFLNRTSSAARHVITSIYICHTSYGEPKWTKDVPWKATADNAWDRVCARLSQELISLKALELHLHLADWPMQLNPNNEDAGWARPLLHFRSSMTLEWVKVRMEHYRFEASQCLSASLQAQKKMISRQIRMTSAEKQDEEVLDTGRCLRGDMARRPRKPMFSCRKEKGNVLRIQRVKT